MFAAVTLEDLQGNYEVAIQSTPLMPNWFQIERGNGTLVGANFTGQDGLGVAWKVEIQDNGSNKFNFQAVLDPRNAAPNAGLMSKNGTMTREPQSYNGVFDVVKIGNQIVLKTSVQQGPITIIVQLLKKT